MKFLQEIINGLSKNDLGDETKYYVDTHKLLKELSCYEVEIPTELYNQYKNEFGNGVLQYLETLTNKDMSEFNGDNTYNYSGHILNDLDYRSVECNDEYYYAIQVHLGGDIRGNYTDFFIVKFEYDCQFYEVLNDLSREQCWFSINVNNKNYMVNPQVMSEYLDVWCQDTDEDIYDIYACCDEDLIEQIKNKVKGMSEDDK